MRFIERRPTVSWFWTIASLVLLGIALYGLASGEAILLPSRFSESFIAYWVDDPAEFWRVIAGTLLLALGFALLAFFHSPYLIDKFAEGRGGRKPTHNFLIVILILGSLLAALIMLGLYGVS